MGSDHALRDWHVAVACAWTDLLLDAVQALKEVDAKHKMLLTGTPLQNNIAELFMLMHFLDRGKFGSLEEFEAEFANIGHEQQVGQWESRQGHPGT